uniref:Synaptobrevin, longin-like domain protein n=1 Tax=Tanacetum cinerariifolium TaxID=118510 RepID=A0A699IP43_TANCI|nr:hypothetical protein [Tanacetum cinerariifolium]
MVAILEKSEQDIDFHPIIDFVEASQLRYALTFKPTIYVFHIRQFWSTARIETTNEGTKILATVDGILRTVSESSIRRNLKLKDKAGINSLLDVELFENLTLMGYNISPNQKFTFQKGHNIATALVCLATNRIYNFSKMIFDGMVNSPSFLGRIAPLFDTMLVQQGEGSGTPTEPHHTPSPEAQQTSPTTHSSPTLPPVTTAPILTVTPIALLPTVVPTDTPHLRHYTKRARIAQSSALLPVADEPASLLRDVSQGKACPTDFGFKADQERASIAKTSTLPNDSTPRVISLAADEGNMQHKLDKLMALCTNLQREQLEMVVKFVAQELEINREEGVERVSDDTEEMATILTSMDAATVLSSEVAKVSTRSGSIPTANPPATGVPIGSDVVSTAGLIFATATVVTPYTRRKGKEKMIESETPKKKKIQEQMDIQMARQLEEEMERDAQRMNEQIARDEYEQIPEDLSIGERIELMSDLTKDFKGMSFEQIKAKFNTIWKQIKDIIPIGSKEETERFKRKGLRLEQESAKKLKTSEEVPEEVKLSEEVPEEKVKEMMQLVPVEEIYVEVLQVKHPIIDWKVHTEGQRSYWKITRLGGRSASYQFFVDMLKHLDREDLNQL